MTLELHATPQEVMRAVEALQQFGHEKHVPEKALFGLMLGLEECGSNIVNHALQRDPQKTFEVRVEHAESAIFIELRDRGPEFDPTRVPEPTADAEDDERPPGGWGVQLVRRYMDDISYRREDGQNILRLTSRITPERGQK